MKQKFLMNSMLKLVFILGTFILAKTLSEELELGIPSKAILIATIAVLFTTSYLNREGAVDN